MITIALTFGVIGYLEWRYLQNNNRKQRTIWIVMGTALFLMLFMEAVYLSRNRSTIAIIIENIFSPIQKLLFAN